MKTEHDDLEQATDEQSQAMADRRIPWPENPRGFVVGQQSLEDFLGNQTLYQAQATAKRFVAVAEAAGQIAKGQQVDLNFRLIHFIASEDKSEGYQQVMKLMLKAIDQGEEGITAVRSTAMHVMDFGFDYMTSYGYEFIYEEGVERMRQEAGRLD
jgi:hypothetical protein